MIEKDFLDLSGQVAFVTGAGQGAGREIALILAQHNAGGVVVNDFVLDRAQAVAAEIDAIGVRAIPVQADVGDLASVHSAFHEARAALGPITILVNNAGNAGPAATMRRSPLFWESDPAEWGRFFHTNLFGVMNCCYTALPEMVGEQRGRIVTIVSDSGRVGEARLAAYGASKAGAAGFVRSIAKEAGRFGITCNAISLSTLEPPMEAEQLEQFLNSDQVKAQLSHYIIRRYGKPSDVASMTLFLCSDNASWITGQTYPVNGGYSVAV